MFEKNLRLQDLIRNDTAKGSERSANENLDQGQTGGTTTVKADG